METTSFGTTKRGEETLLFTLQNKNGLRAKLTNYGAALVEMWAPDRNGENADVILGFENVTRYESEDNQSFGCTTGRCANRIAKGRFSLDGREYVLAVNNGPNHLHGGNERRFSRVVWDAVENRGEQRGPALRFSYVSPDREEGYPGCLTLSVTYTLTDADELEIQYLARTDAPTIVNLTNHAYWNLSGAGAASVLDHRLQIFADQYTPVDADMIPTGELCAVQGSALDFRAARRVGERIGEVSTTCTNGYDHNFVVRGTPGVLRPAARLEDPAGGRVMEVHTSEPGIQLYTGNYLKNQRGKSGRAYAPRSALCLEAQHYPDSIHHPQFPSVVLRPGETYRQTTVHRFSCS